MNKWMITFFLLTSCLTLAPSRGVLFNWLPRMGYLNPSLISFYLLISLYFPHLHLPQTYSVRVISILNWSYIFLWVCFSTQSASRNKRMAPFSDCWACGVSSSERTKGKSLWTQSTDCFLHPWIWPCIVAVSTSSSSPVQCCSFSPFWISFSTIFWS